MTDREAIHGTIEQIERLIEGIRLSEDAMAADPENAVFIDANRNFMKSDIIRMLTEIAPPGWKSLPPTLHDTMSDNAWCNMVINFLRPIVDARFNVLPAIGRRYQHPGAVGPLVVGTLDQNDQEDLR